MLYPEVCNLFGDISNIKYLKKCLPDAEIIKTEINSEPAFVTQDIDMIYMGPMPENIQEVAIRKLRPYKEKIEELIKKNVVFLVTGNAVELFGKYIEASEVPSAFLISGDERRRLTTLGDAPARSPVTTTSPSFCMSGERHTVCMLLSLNTSFKGTRREP